MPHDADDEIRFHLEQRTADLIRAGVPAAEAERRARAEFGDVAAARARLAASAGELRARRRRRMLREELGQDLRYGARQLRAHPGFTAIAVLTLALGAGATAAIFGVVDTVLLRPLPYADGDRLVMVWESHPERTDRSVVSRGNYLDWREQAAPFETLGAYMPGFGYSITGDGDAAYWVGSQVTPSLFEVLGVEPSLGRALVEDEDAIVLSDGLWRRRYGGDRDVLGRRVVVDGSPYTIVGVMPPRFDFPSAEVEFWLPTPLPETYRQQREAHVFHVVGRLRPGATVASADAAMDDIARRIAQTYPAEMTGWSVNVVPLRTHLTGAVRPALLVLLGAVALVLLMACANVTNLLLTRSTARGREVAVRTALGAGRGRLMRQFLTESALLALLGGVAGLALAYALLRGFVVFGPADVPFLEHARLDLRVAAVTLAILGIVTVLIGWLPALRASRADVQSWLREEAGRGASGARHQRARHVILAAEVALSVVLLVAAGLLVRSLLRVQAVDTGYDADDVVLAWLSLPTSRDVDPVGFYDEVLERVATLPGIRVAAGSSEPPIDGFDMTRSFEVEGRPDAFEGGRDDYPFRLVTPRWFDAMGVDVLAGRAFTPADRDGAAPVAIVNRALADLLWRDGDPVGRRIRFGEDAPWLEIVGVVEDVRHYGLERPERPALYAPYAQKTWSWLTWMTIAVRGPANVDAIAPALRTIVRDIDAAIPVQRVTTVRDLYADSLARRRFQTGLVAAFAAAALLLGSIGIYGVASYGVAQRADELRVRLALGARRAQIITMILRQQLAVVLAGAAVGTLIAALAARLVASQLFGVPALDTTTFVASVALLVGTAALAAWLAARRAASGPLRPG